MRFFARGVGTSTYKIAYGKSTYVGTTVCGAMYSFGVATAGGKPAAGSVSWTMDQSYLPAMTTSLTHNNVKVVITNFEDQATISGHTFGVVYSRVTLTNNSSSSMSIDPQPSTGLTELTTTSLTVAAGASATHDYAVAVDDFGSGQTLPTGTALTGAISNYDTAYAHMSRLLERAPDGDPGVAAAERHHPAVEPLEPGDRALQRLQGQLRLHAHRPGRQVAVFRRQQLRLAA